MMVSSFEWNRTSRFPALLVLLLSLQMMSRLVVDATGTLELHMNSFLNPTEHLVDGSCCDQFCIGECDDIFHFALDQSSGSTTDAKSYYYWVKVTGTYQDQNNNYFNDDMHGVKNPIIWNFDSWPGTVLFKVYIEDDDSPFTSNDPLDSIIQRLTLTPAKSKALATSTTITAQGTRSKDKTTLSFDYKLYCDDNFYGTACSVYCVELDSTRGHYSCDPDTGAKVCRPGWEDLTTNCTIFSDDCVNNACLNGARCIDGVRSYTCQCAAGYTGVHCETNINECQSNPCMNGGTCSDMVNGYICSCTSGYVGPQCRQTACSSQSAVVCQNGGTCYGNLNCLCPTGYIGNRCELRTCEALPCLNGGSCTSNNTCVCPVGYTGNQCEVRACDYVSAHCQNGGICANGTCICPKPYSGVNCEKMDCGCLNGGNCVGYITTTSSSSSGGGTGVTWCVCPSSYTGIKCETVVSATPSDQDDVTASPLQGEKDSDVSVFIGDGGALLIALIVICICLLLIVIILVVILICLRRRQRNAPKKRAISTVSALTSVSTVESSTVSTTTRFDNAYVDDDVFSNSESGSPMKDPLEKPWKKQTKGCEEEGNNVAENHYERLEERGYVDEKKTKEKVDEVVPDLPERLPSTMRELPEHLYYDVKDVHGEPMYVDKKLADC